jgi:hypothetical protein
MPTNSCLEAIGGPVIFTFAILLCPAIAKMHNYKQS